MNRFEHKITGVDNLIVSHLAGSHAYGMSTPESDVDVRGIFCGTQENIRTPWFPCREQTIPEMEDAKVYELTNFMKLYLDCNPNIIETLWVPEESIIQSSEAYGVLQHYRKDLLSSKVAFTFSGYAMSQMKRIKGHNKFINNPKSAEPPRQTDFVSMVQNFTSAKILSRMFTLESFRHGRLVPFGNNLFGLYIGEFSDKAKGYETFSDDFTLNTVFDDESRSEYGAPHLIVKFNKDEYLRENDDHKNYWNWKANRNKKRSVLEEHHGYDTKHASHLIRLLRMGEEILTTGEVIVKRPDAQELLDIRAGKYTYNELLAMAEGKDELIRGELYKNTCLRRKPDVKLASKVLMTVQDIYWRE
jgi:hypothetical protein